MPLEFEDAFTLSDVTVFLQRADRLGADSVRAQADEHTLALFVAALWPKGLLDATPTILGLRLARLAEPQTADRTVAVRSLLERIAHVPAGAAGPIEWPPADVTVAWAGVLPPRRDWVRIGEVGAGLLAETARAGAAEIANALPADAGEAIVHKVRSEVWSRPLEGAAMLPAGAAFAAEALGFLADDAAALYTSGSWLRLSTARGHVLTKTLAG